MVAPLSRALVVLYPFLLHFCIATSRPAIAAWYLAGLLTLPLINDLVEKPQSRVSPVGVAGVVLAMILLTVLRSQEMLIFKILPLSIYALLFWLFTRSLVSGRTPLISKVAQYMDAGISPVELSYTRSVTVAWAVFFLAMGLMSGVLAVAASDEAWSWFVNIISYLLIGLFFVLEFAVRRQVLGSAVNYGFIDFLSRLTKIDMRQLLFPRR